jgi:hypothetical protein
MSIGYYERLLEYARDQRIRLPPGIHSHPHRTQRCAIIRLDCRPPKVVARTIPGVELAESYVRDVYARELGAHLSSSIQVVDLLMWDIYRYSPSATLEKTGTFIPASKRLGNKSYSIDSILALNSDVEFASTLYKKLNEAVPLETEGEYIVCSAYECDGCIGGDGLAGWFQNSAALLLIHRKSPGSAGGLPKFDSSGSRL